MLVSAVGLECEQTTCEQLVTVLLLAIWTGTSVYMCYVVDAANDSEALWLLVLV